MNLHAKHRLIDQSDCRWKSNLTSSHTCGPVSSPIFWQQHRLGIVVVHVCLLDI